MGGAVGPRPKPLTLEERVTTNAAVEVTIGCPGPTHKRAMGNAAMQIRVEGKKRGPIRGWGLMIGPKPNRKFWPCAWEEDMRQTGGSSPREEDSVSIRCRKKRVRGRRIRSGFTSNTINIGFDRMVSNAYRNMTAMH